MVIRKYTMNEKRRALIRGQNGTKQFVCYKCGKIIENGQEVVSRQMARRRSSQHGNGRRGLPNTTWYHEECWDSMFY